MPQPTSASFHHLLASGQVLSYFSYWNVWNMSPIQLQAPLQQWDSRHHSQHGDTGWPSTTSPIPGSTISSINAGCICASVVFRLSRPPAATSSTLRHLSANSNHAPGHDGAHGQLLSGVSSRWFPPIRAHGSWSAEERDSRSHHAAEELAE